MIAAAPSPPAAEPGASARGGTPAAERRLRRFGPRSNLTRADGRWLDRATGWAVAVWLLWAAALWSHGAALPYPLDDAFIYQRYADLLAQGEWFAYNPGEGMTSGATSPLWALLLAPGHAAGLERTLATLPAGLLGFGFLLLTFAGVYELTRRAAHCLAAVGAVAFVALSGYAYYFYFSGMETGMFAWQLVVTLLAAARWEQRPSAGARRALLGWASLLPWGRPEGLVVLVLVGAWVAARDGDLRARARELAAGAGAAGAGGEAPAAPWRRPAWQVVPLAFVPWGVWSAALWLGTGTMEPNGHALKGLLPNATAGTMEKAAFVADALGELLGGFYANRFSYYHLRGADALAHPAWLLPVALAGLLASAARRGETLRRPGFVLLTLATLVGGVGATTLNESYTGHNYRYQAPFQPLLLVGYALGWWWIATAAAHLIARPTRGDVASLAAAEADDLRPLAADRHGRSAREVRRDQAFLLAVAATGAVLASSLPWWADFYARNARDISRQHLLLSLSGSGALEASGRATPARAGRGPRLGLTDAGVLPYYWGPGGATFHDYAGLVTNGQARWLRAGLGSLWESLERLPPGRRPTLNSGYLDVIARPDGMHFMGTMVGEARLLANTVTGGGRLMLWVPPWEEPDLAGAWRPWAWAFARDAAGRPLGHDATVFARSERPFDARFEGLPVVAACDIADLDDEAAMVTWAGGRPALVAEPGPVFGALDPRNTFLVEAGPPLRIDGGRAVAADMLRGGVRVRWSGATLREPVRPGSHYLVVLRTGRVPSWIGDQGRGVEVVAGGQARRLELTTLPDAGRFVELAVAVSGLEGDVEVRLRGDALPGTAAWMMAYHLFLLGPVDAAAAAAMDDAGATDEATSSGP